MCINMTVCHAGCGTLVVGVLELPLSFTVPRSATD